MIEKPTNTRDALTNAILAAEEAHMAAREQRPYPADTWAHVSEAWSRIASELDILGPPPATTDAHPLDEAMPDLPEHRNILARVRKAIAGVFLEDDEPLSKKDINDIITAIQNAGIVFCDRGGVPVQPVLTETEVEWVMAARHEGGTVVVLPSGSTVLDSA